MNKSNVCSRGIIVSSDSIKFHCAHFVAREGYSERLHGHNYTVMLQLGSGNSLASDGYVLDFSVVKQILRKLTSTFNEHFIVPLECKALDIHIPSQYRKNKSVETSDMKKQDFRTSGGITETICGYGNLYRDDDVTQKGEKCDNSKELDLPNMSTNMSTSSSLHLDNGESITVRVKHSGKTYIFPVEDCLLLSISNSTAEELAHYICTRVIDALDIDRRNKEGRDLKWIQINVNETPSQGAWYRVDFE